MSHNWLSGQKETLAHPNLTLVIGLLTMTVFIIVFGVLGFSIESRSSIVAEDHSMVNALHQVALAGPGWLITLMLAISDLGKWVIIGLALLIGLYWLFNKMWRELVMLILGVAGGAGWFLFLANLIGRHRPQFPNPIHIVPYPSFPSGHLISTTTFYGLLLYLFIFKARSTTARVLLLTAFILLLGLVSYSRLYLGDHYPTDVIAGSAVGLAWSALVYSSIDWFVAHHQSR